MGLSTIAAVLADEEETIEDVYEPYLMQIGFIERTPRGRVATRAAYGHIGKKYKEQIRQALLFSRDEAKEKENAL